MSCPCLQETQRTDEKQTAVLMPPDVVRRKWLYIKHFVVTEKKYFHLREDPGRLQREDNVCPKTGWISGQTSVEAGRCVCVVGDSQSERGSKYVEMQTQRSSAVTSPVPRGQSDSAGSREGN